MIRVYIIDCDVAVRLAARRTLDPAGFSVSEVADVASVPLSRPDLVIADLAVTSLAAIRSKYPASRILAISDSSVAAGEAGLIASSLKTPFTPSQLLTAVRLCLARSGATKG